MATWQPYWITFWPENPTELVSYLDTTAYQIWNWSFKWFSRYWAGTKIQDGHLAAILNCLSARKSNWTWIWYNCLPNLKVIVQTVLKILSWKENPRWLSWGHTGLPISLKIQLKLHITLIQLPTKFETDHSNGSQNIGKKRKSKMAVWRPYWISYRPEIKFKVYLTLIQLPIKFETDRSNGYQDIKQKQKSKMAAWRPYLITYQSVNPTELASYLDTIAYQIWNWSFIRFLRYWAKMKIQNGRLSAISDYL